MCCTALSTALKIGWKMVTPFLTLLNNLPFLNPLPPHQLTDLPLTNSQPMFVGMAYFAYFCKTKARNGGGECAIGHANHARKRSKRKPETCHLPT